MLQVDSFLPSESSTQNPVRNRRRQMLAGHVKGLEVCPSAEVADVSVAG